MWGGARLRGHHLICLHFFDGKGYSAGFVENLRETLQRAEAQGVEVAGGPDDVCLKCPHLDGSSCNFEGQSEGEISDMDEFALMLLNVSPGDRRGWDVIREELPVAFPTWEKLYCGRCLWRKACEDNGFYARLRINK